MFKSARRRYLESENPQLLKELKQSGKLEEHLRQVDEEAQEVFDTVTEKLLKKNPIPEDLKNTDTLLWIQLRNQVYDQARETAVSQVCYS